MSVNARMCGSVRLPLQALVSGALWVPRTLMYSCSLVYRVSPTTHRSVGSALRGGHQ